MAKKKEPAEGNEGIAEGALRELGFGSLVDFALKSPVFKQRFREVNQQVEERLSREIVGGRRQPVSDSEDREWPDQNFI